MRTIPNTVSYILHSILTVVSYNGNARGTFNALSKKNLYYKLNYKLHKVNNRVPEYPSIM